MFKSIGKLQTKERAEEGKRVILRLMEEGKKTLNPDQACRGGKGQFFAAA